MNLLGKLAPRLEKRTLRMTKYLKAPPAPRSQDWTGAETVWPMYLNDTLGDCVVAASGHMIEEWTANAGKPFQPDNAQILKAYEDVGGYIPGDPSTDNGAVMLDALNYWRQTGIAGHTILAYVGIDPLKSGSFDGKTWRSLEIMDAIWLFGAAYIGLQMPLSAQGMDIWTVPPGGAFGDGSPGSWGGHCVPVVSYSQNGLTVITWGQKMRMSWNFLHAYADEAYGVLSQDWIEANNQAPNHFDLVALKADLQRITG